MDKNIVNMPIAVAVWSRALLVGIVGSSPVEGWNSVSCGCYVLSGRSLFVGLITCPEESYPV